MDQIILGYLALIALMVEQRTRNAKVVCSNQTEGIKSRLNLDTIEMKNMFNISNAYLTGVAIGFLLSPFFGVILWFLIS